MSVFHTLVLCGRLCSGRLVRYPENVTRKVAKTLFVCLQIGLIRHKCGEPLNIDQFLFSSRMRWTNCRTNTRYVTYAKGDFSTIKFNRGLIGELEKSK
jgi:hypothetical protein